jgi:hypothetical protein
MRTAVVAGAAHRVVCAPLALQLHQALLLHSRVLILILVQAQPAAALALRSLPRRSPALAVAALNGGDGPRPWTCVTLCSKLGAGGGPALALGRPLQLLWRGEADDVVLWPGGRVRGVLLRP